MKNEQAVKAAFEYAAERYAAIGVDVNEVLKKCREYLCRCIAGRPTMFRDLKIRRRIDRRNTGYGKLSR